MAQKAGRSTWVGNSLSMPATPPPGGFLTIRSSTLLGGSRRPARAPGREGRGARRCWPSIGMNLVAPSDTDREGLVAVYGPNLAPGSVCNAVCVLVVVGQAD